MIGGRFAAELHPSLRPCIRQYQPEFERAPRLAEHRWIRGVDIGVEGDIQTDMQNRPLTSELEVTVLQVNTHDGDRCQFKLLPQYGRLDEDFEISDGVVLPMDAVDRFTRTNWRPRRRSTG